MMMSDGKGIICTILYGQTGVRRSSTRRALYVAYAPIGVPVGAVRQQLIRSVRTSGLRPEAEVEMKITLRVAG